MSLRVEPERPGDEPAISRVHAVAFRDADRASDAEVRLVEALRFSEAWVRQLSLVARLDGEVVGHLLFSRAVIAAPTGDVDVLALAPLGVLPGYERFHVGTRLMRAGLAEAHRLCFAAVVVLGHPKYYRRFGFRPAERPGVRAPFPVPTDAWMALELVPGALAGVEGLVRYPPAFAAVT